MTGREELRQTFESAAATYHAARPRFPAVLFDTLQQAVGLTAPADLLEIGCATGIATEPMARRGYRITCVELRPTLAAQARGNLAAYPDVTVVCASFDTWTPPAWGAFDLVYAATAWHWLDPQPDTSGRTAHLRPGGALAFWSATHVVPDDGDQLLVDLQQGCDEIGESQPSDWDFPRPGELADQAAEITVSGLFTPVVVRHFDWGTTHDPTATSRCSTRSPVTDHAAVATPAPLQRDPPPTCPTTERHRAPPLGCGPARRHPNLLTHDAVHLAPHPAFDRNRSSAGAIDRSATRVGG